MRSTRTVSIAVLLLVLAGPLSAQPAPQPLQILDVPFISQSEALCGGAAAAMVLRYWGERGLTAESFAGLVDRSAAGIRTTSLIGELRRRGWNATGVEGTAAQIATELERGRPVLALIQDRPGTFHYIVIVATTGGAIVFHDPARAPMRVMAAAEFTARWQAADRWMAVIVPGARTPAPPEAAAVAASAATPCEQMVAEGVAHAQANDLDAAERRLAAALSCPGPAAMRELAGVRLLQRRWADVEALAGAAVAIDAEDAHAWRLLGTSRFLQNDRLGALDAWNRVSEPRIDLLRVDGLSRTRQRVVERLLAQQPGDLLTADVFTRAARRLGELPAASSTRLEYVPVPSGLAELRATVNERPLAPSDGWSYAALGLFAAASREIEYSTGSLAGGGERLTGGWRFWPGRPRVAVSLAAPAPWGGTWAVGAFSERQPFDGSALPDAERTAADLRVSQWVTPTAHVTARGGVDEWEHHGLHGMAGAELRLRSRADRVDARVSGAAWAGRTTFASAAVTATARSSTARLGRVYVARAGAGAVSGATPPDAWLAGDTGDTRPVLLRAHPLVDEGRLRAERLGRRILHASVEAQHWWPVSIARVGAALFLDTARAGATLAGPPQGDVDVGLGARLAAPGLPGTFRVDVARGLRDGATRWSFVYDPSGW